MVLVFITMFESWANPTLFYRPYLDGQYGATRTG